MVSVGVRVATLVLDFRANDVCLMSRARCPSGFRLQARRRRELPELKAVEDDHAWDAVSSLPPAICILHAAPHLPQPSLSLLGSLVRARLGTIPDWTPLVRRRAPPHSSHVPREGALSLAQSQWKYFARRAHEGRTCRACAPNRTGDELLPRALRARAADRQRWHRTSNIERVLYRIKWITLTR